MPISPRVRQHSTDKVYTCDKTANTEDLRSEQSYSQRKVCRYFAFEFPISPGDLAGCPIRSLAVLVIPILCTHYIPPDFSVCPAAATISFAVSHIHTL